MKKSDPTKRARDPDTGLYWRVIFADGLNIRADSDKNSEIVGSLEHGDVVKEVERKRGWVRHDRGGWTTTEIVYEAAGYMEPAMERHLC